MSSSPPASSASDMEAALADTLGDIVARLQALPGDAQTKRQFMGRLLVSLLRAAGTKDSRSEHNGEALPLMKDNGLELNGMAAVGSVRDQEAALDQQLHPGQRAARDYNGICTHFSVYPWPRPNIGASATVFCEDAAGELYVLLVRKNSDPEVWMRPGGFVDQIPDPDEALGEEGKRGLSFRNTAPHTHAEYVERLQQGWIRAANLMHGRTDQRAALARRGVDLPPDGDLNSLEAAIREVWEEGGVKVEAHHFIKDLGTELSYGSSSANQRSYTAVPQFMIDMGRVEAVPEQLPFADTDEIKDAAWIRVDSIMRNQQTGEYTVPAFGNRQRHGINPYTIPSLEASLQALLEHRIQLASDGKLDSPRNVYANMPRIAVALELPLPDPEHGTLPTLLGKEGQEIMGGYVRAAESFDQLSFAGRRQVDNRPGSGLDSPLRRH